MTTNPVVKYRSDGRMIMLHFGDKKGRLSCGQPRGTGEPYTIPDIIPACPECAEIARDAALEYYARLKLWED